jgi:hypothetical protein
VEVAATGGLTSTLGVGKSALVGNVSVFRWMVIVTLALSAACSSSGSDGVVPLAASADTSVAPAPPTTTRPDDRVVTTISPWNEEQLEVIAAFEAAELAFRRASEHPVDPGSHAVQETHTAETAAEAFGILQGRVADGVAVRWSGGLRLVVVYSRIEVAADIAILEGCLLDDGELISLETGSVLSRSDAMEEVAARLIREGDRWLLDAIEFDSGGGRC